MKNGSLFSSLLVIASLFLASSALAQVSVTETSPAPGPSYDGIYISPYYATVGGVTNTPIICDDFGDETWQGSTWNASVTSFSSITSTNTSWGLAGANTALYGAIGYLTMQVLSAAPGSTNQIIDTFALWAVFDPKGVESYLATNQITSGSLTTAQLCDDIFGDSTGCTTTKVTGGLLALAESYTTGQFSNLAVLSPLAGSALCTAETGCAAQEFIVKVAEGGATITYVFLAGLCCLVAICVKSRRPVRAELSR